MRSRTQKRREALLYQATGSESSSPNEIEFRDEGTHNARGLQKYVLARQQLSHLGDTAGWLFGKEVAALHGRANNFVVILSPFSITVRAHAKLTIRHALYGIAPTKAEEKQLAEMIAKQNKELLDIFKNQQRQ